MGEHKKIEVDGVTYRVKRLRAMASLKFLARATRLLGPALRALALSGDAREFLKAATFEDAKITELLDKDVGAQFPLLMSAFGDVAETIDEDELLSCAELLLVGNLQVTKDGHPMDVDDLKTYDACMAEAMERHGVMHQLKLLWAATRMNLFPTSAGGAGGSPGTSKTKE
jgi:hypothetical protein